MKPPRTPFLVAFVVVVVPFGVAVVRYDHGPVRRDQQQVQLRAMLAGRGDRFRHVEVDTAGRRSITMRGYVRTEEEAADLRAEMTRVCGSAEMGKTALFRVAVVPPGKFTMRNGEDFWAYLENEPGRGPSHGGP
jgi:hypothetical protein